jgi:hypothetical protein
LKEQSSVPIQKQYCFWSSSLSQEDYFFSSALIFFFFETLDFVLVLIFFGKESGTLDFDLALIFFFGKDNGVIGALEGALEGA